MKALRELRVLVLFLLAPALVAADDCPLPPSVLEGEYFADLHVGFEIHGRSDLNRVLGLRAGRFLFDDFGVELSVDRVRTGEDDLTEALAGVVVTREPARRGWMSLIGLGVGLSDSHPAVYLSLGGEYRTSNDRFGVRVEMRQMKVFGDSGGRRDSFVGQPMVSLVYHWGNPAPQPLPSEEVRTAGVSMLPPLTNPPMPRESVSLQAMSMEPRDREFLVRFAKGSSSPSVEATAVVAQVVAILEREPAATLFIAGHSDVAVGGLSDVMAERQMRLGRERAEALLPPFREAGIARERVQYETNGTNEERLGTVTLTVRIRSSDQGGSR